ncbi:sigma-54-dependent Fis family transcriptional regulator [Siminovitchia acidinfaciens]|uniref:Sigma-54-dependent Fis family transcriptional regulator n=1 Tax=Siminovitchia acidinfaciens TaxID=2321395 RepID=A0A429XVZ9_9BACI|nr:sigma-54 dependent transcriptional regulator [Siminovitchia acidinfaciens]RST72516.1 sigma-54-dependent Fis family transcriptional regulator [Siminovitchia acidinfaciens]
MTNILIVDDDREVGNFLNYFLKEKGLNVYMAYSGKDFCELFEKQSYQLALIDVKLPDTSGLDILKNITEKMPACKTIVMTGYSTVKVAVDAIKLGANDFIEKPFDDLDALEMTIDQLLANKVTTAESDIQELARTSGIITGKSDTMNRLLALAYKIAPKNINVLIEGETGTGKELFANFLHYASQRNGQPFIGINCGALSESLLESELFGHEKGAFTGASKERRGVFELAGKGTLFLDEVGEASMSTQVKLLRVLETGEFMRVGGETVQKTNTRIVAATHVDLTEAVKNRAFREDLLYRLDVVKLVIPPLRERREDIPLIANHLLNKAEEKIQLSEEAAELMQQYDWPGNVRELSNVIKRTLTIMDEGSSMISPRHLPVNIRTGKLLLIEKAKPTEATFEEYLKKWTDDMLDVWRAEEKVEMEMILNKVKDLEREIGRAFVLKVLKETIGDRQDAAKRLNISMRKLRYLLNEKGQPSVK